MLHPLNMAILMKAIKHNSHRRGQRLAILILFIFITLVGFSNNILQSRAATKQGFFYKKWGSIGCGPYRFQDPNGIAVDSSGCIYISDGDCGLTKYQGNGKFLKIFIRPASTSGIAIDESDYIYVGDSLYCEVWVYNPEGDVVAKWGGYGSADGYFKSIEAITINASGYVYIADSIKNEVQVFTRTGQFISRWTVTSSPKGIAISSDGLIYLTFEDSVQIFNQGGKYLGTFSGYGLDQPGFFYSPSGIAFDSTGYLYVSFSCYSTVKIFDNNGLNGHSSYDCSLGSQGSENGQFNHPSAVAVNNQGYVYVVDAGNSRIQIFTPQLTIEINGVPVNVLMLVLITVFSMIAIIMIVYRKKIPSSYRHMRDMVRGGVKVIQEKWMQSHATAEQREHYQIRKAEEVQKRKEMEHQRDEAEEKRRVEEQQRRLQEQKRKAEVERQRREAEEQRMRELKNNIERVILDLAPQVSRLQVKEIAERAGIIDESLIIQIVQEMIARRQIEGIYFKSTRSIALHQHGLEQPFPSEVVQTSATPTEILRQYEYIGGKVRVKVKVINLSKGGLLRVRCMLNIPDSFHLLRVEPSDYSVEGSTVKLQDLLPKEEKAVAFILEPMICGKEQFSGTVSGVDAAGSPFATSIAPLEVEVRCPLFANPEEANLPLLQRMVLDLPVKSERVFYLPETLSPANAFELAKSAITERDVRFVGSVTAEDRKEGDPFDESAWFYGITKVEKKRYVLSAAVSEKDRIIRLATACDDEAGCTGYLAETGAAVRRELVRRGAYESEMTVIELICEKCGSTLRSAPTNDHDVRCPECQWSWRAKDFFH